MPATLKKKKKKRGKKKKKKRGGGGGGGGGGGVVGGGELISARKTIQTTQRDNTERPESPTPTDVSPAMRVSLYNQVPEGRHYIRRFFYR